MIYVLNSPVITGPGYYRYSQVSRESAAELLNGNEFVSAVGHQATAEMLTRLLGIQIPCARVEVSFKPGDCAVVFRLLRRLPEGAVLTEQELSSIPYELGLLERVE